MPRGRHRHSPPLHRLLPPSAIAGVSLVCAFGPWVFSEQSVLRVIAAFAAAIAVVGAAVMRRWDAQAGKQVADLTRARASDEWRHEERVAELETDLEESRELRAKLEQRLRAKRAELAGLRNEHAALLRRYATAETERASALEGRRLLEIEAAVPGTPALPPAPTQDAGAAGAAEAETTARTEAVAASAQEAEDIAEDIEDAADAADAEDVGSAEGGEGAEGGDEKPAGPAVFSPEGSQLFLRAKEALKKFDEDGDGSPDDNGAEDGIAEDVGAERGEDGAQDDGTGPEDDGSPKGDGPSKGVSSKGEPVKAKANPGAAAAVAVESGAVAKEPTASAAEAATGGTEAAAQEDEAQGQPEAVDGHERAAATTPAAPAHSAQPVHQPSGHFVAPTAVAVVPAAPVRRPAVQGGFDFFGTKKDASPAALDAVQNEDLADVVGQEALALHKAEAEAEFKPAGADSRGVGQVIDLTAHDETEQIDMQGLRSAAS